MRTQLLKCNSTKPERIFAETLKSMHIPFRHRVRICGREIDFVVGKYCIEIDGHPQSTSKNEELAKVGYIPIHYSNSEIDNNLPSRLKYLI